VFLVWLVTSVSLSLPILTVVSAGPEDHLAAPTAPPESALVGTIEHFAASARRLVLQTAADAHIRFILAPDAVVRLGSRAAGGGGGPHRRTTKVRYADEREPHAR
jgi:hypothetical protein